MAGHDPAIFVYAPVHTSTALGMFSDIVRVIATRSALHPLLAAFKALLLVRRVQAILHRRYGGRSYERGEREGCGESRENQPSHLHGPVLLRSPSNAAEP
jgi:hypothetical protein